MEDFMQDKAVSSNFAGKTMSPRKARKNVARGRTSFVSVGVKSRASEKLTSKKNAKKLKKLSRAEFAENHADLIGKREKKEMPKTSSKKLLDILSYGFVVFLAAVIGFLAGNMYIDYKYAKTYDYNEADYVYSDAEIASIVSSSSDVSHTNALYAYIKGIEKLKTIDSYVIETPDDSSYTQPNIASRQAIYAKRVKNGNNYSYESVSMGLMSVAELITTEDAENFDVFVASSIPSLKGSVYPTSPSASYALADFRAEYGTHPMIFSPYVVSNKTIHPSYSGNAMLTGQGTRDDDGNYNFTLKLDTEYSVMNYVRQMKHMSGLNSYPTFDFVTLEFTLDSDFNFLRCKITEEYTIKYFGVPAHCHGELELLFTY